LPRRAGIWYDAPRARGSARLRTSSPRSRHRTGARRIDLGLKGKVALVTGGSRGIGLAIARRFVEEGGAVAISGRDPGRLDAALAALRQAGGDARGYVAHMDRPDEVRALVQSAAAAFGRLDIVVSHAGTSLKGTLDEVPVERLEAHLRAKVLGPWELARQAAPHLSRQPTGRFIVVVGQAGKVPAAGTIGAAVANAAQLAFVKALSDHLGPANILVTAVCASHIRTPRTEGARPEGERYIGRSLEQQESGWGLHVPLGHWGEPDDVANAVVFLASECASFLTGTNLDVDGGYQRMIL
jgi:NAD(P)-dependent dehydrogenase (short-subunit alcohol dehydrogenase family)